jgi:hypothetical protein
MVTGDIPACPKKGGEAVKGTGGKSSVPEKRWRSSKKYRWGIQRARKGVERVKKVPVGNAACPKRGGEGEKGTGGKSSVPEKM